MGGINLINTIINTAYDLLFNTAFYIMAVAVVAGSLSEIFTEFGVIALVNKILSPLIQPIFGLPGASVVGIMTTYLSDNPAILTFANNKQRGFSRLMESALAGGAQGVQLGLDIIPGILIITTLVLLLTNGTGDVGHYNGSAYQGVGLLPFLGEKIDFILKPMFGFSNMENISVPLTALGAAGAPVGLIPDLIAKGLANSHDIAVFVAMAMCF